MGVGRIYNQMMAYGREKVITSLEQRYRKKLTNEHFTILCSNCIGGIIYNRLGKEFLSPTINLWIRQYDFLKLAQNPRDYMNQKLQFVESQYDFPVALLGDIRIHFNHSKTEEEAARDWYRRVERIDYDNLYVIMYDRDDLSREQIEAAGKIDCRRVVVFTEHDRYGDLDHVYHIDRCQKARPDTQVFIDKDFWGVRTFEKQFDFVGWLNGEKISRAKQ